MTANPTLDPDDYSRQLIQETVRPGLASYLEDAERFDDPEADRRGDPHPDEAGQWPPLVVTPLPGGGRVLYPHVVVREANDSAGPIDARRDFGQHAFAIEARIHGGTATEMFNLRGLVRGYFLTRRDELRDAGFAIKGDDAIDGNSADWDPTSSTWT